MENGFFKLLEPVNDEERIDLNECIDHLVFNAAGLIPVITQCHHSGEVLMQAWMNHEAICRTLASGRMTYWSRSRETFWVKGETSGHIQTLKSMRFDCDGDAIFCLVQQEGAACHTGRPSCFYFEVHAAQCEVRQCPQEKKP